MKIKIKYFTDLEKIQKIEKGNWIDLRCAADIYLKKGEFYLIPLGIAVQLPEGYEAITAPRSSTFKNYGIIQTNSIGVIDESYCGDNDQWMYPVYSTKDTFIKKNSRIAQFRIIEHQPDFEIEEVEFLNNKDRDGFGSTGK